MDRLKQALKEYKQNKQNFKPYHISMRELNLWLEQQKGK